MGHCGTDEKIPDRTEAKIRRSAQQTELMNYPKDYLHFNFCLLSAFWAFVFSSTRRSVVYNSTVYTGRQFQGATEITSREESSSPPQTMPDTSPGGRPNRLPEARRFVDKSRSVDGGIQVIPRRGVAVSSVLVLFSCLLQSCGGLDSDYVSQETKHKTSSGGAEWSGDMHPSLPLGSGHACDKKTLQGCQPSYGQLKAAGALWKCPDGKKGVVGTCGADGCVESAGGGDNPQCPGQLNASSSCCCPKNGCYTLPLYNTVIGVCRGTGCACGDASAPSCAPQGQPDACGGSVGGKTCNGPMVRCCFGANVEELVPFYDLGTQAIVNYWAAYEFSASNKEWVIQAESSFNTNASRPPCNLTAPHCGLNDASQSWLSPQPGGSMFWSLGYYPAGVRGVGSEGGAAMWVLSTEQFWGATWYMLNQLTLDRGPATGIPQEECAITNDNCWASGNAGEMDFLETGWNLRNISEDPDYRRSFSTQFNQIGRCFNGGVNGGGFTSPNWLETSPSPIHGKKPEPYVFVAIVDSVGNWVYRIPADEASDIWPGISRKTTASRLQASPTRTPVAMNPCNKGFCAVFTSNCQATNVTEAQAQGCGFNGNQGFCGNVFRQFADTNQPLYPNSTCTKDVRGGVEMPWCLEMVHADPTPAPSPGPPPTSQCPACTPSQCAGEGCGKSVPYLCLAGIAKGGCTSNAKGWPSSGACSGCCDTYLCGSGRNEVNDFG